MTAKEIDDLTTPQSRLDAVYAQVEKQTARVDARIAEVGADWMKAFAIMQVSGVSMTSCAERLGRPLSVLKNVYSSGAFQKMLLDYAKETETDAATNMVKASAVDAVMVMTGLLTSLNENIRLRAASKIMDIVFTDKFLKLTNDKSTLADALEKHGGNVEAASMAEIMRHLEQDPTLKHLRETLVPANS